MKRTVSKIIWKLQILRLFGELAITSPGQEMYIWSLGNLSCEKTGHTARIPSNAVRISGLLTTVRESVTGWWGWRGEPKVAQGAVKNEFYVCTCDWQRHKCKIGNIMTKVYIMKHGRSGQSHFLLNLKSLILEHLWLKEWNDSGENPLTRTIWHMHAHTCIYMYKYTLYIYVYV